MANSDTRNPDNETETAADRMLRLYGKFAAEECESRARYHAMNGDTAFAEEWERTAEVARKLMAVSYCLKRGDV